MELMVLGMWESTTGSHTSAVELIIGIVHLITTEDCFQARLVEGLIMGNKRQAFNHRLYLFPYFRKNRSFFCVTPGKPMNPCVPIIIVIRFRLNQRIELVHNLSAPYNNHAYGAYTCTFCIGRLEINRGKVFEPCPDQTFWYHPHHRNFLQIYNNFGIKFVIRQNINCFYHYERKSSRITKAHGFRIFALKLGSISKKC